VRGLCEGTTSELLNTLCKASGSAVPSAEYVKCDATNRRPFLGLKPSSG